MNKTLDTVNILVSGGVIMKKDFFFFFKKKIAAEKNEILESLSGRNEQMSKLVETLESGDDVDIASDTIDRTLFNSLGEADQRRLTMIDRALDRIRQETYGLCLACGKKIPDVRLEALPYAALCIDCQTQEDRRHR